jgi:uncharacterized protein (DUF1330 family)
MAAYLIGAIDIEDLATYAEYRSGAFAALAGFDFEMISTDDMPDIIEGAKPAEHLFIVKFSSREELHKFYRSEAYQKAKAFRDRSSSTRFLMAMRGFEPPAGK